MTEQEKEIAELKQRVEELQKYVEHSERYFLEQLMLDRERWQAWFDCDKRRISAIWDFLGAPKDPHERVAWRHENTKEKKEKEQDG